MKKKSRKVIAVVTAVCVCLLGIGLGWWLLSNSPKLSANMFKGYRTNIEGANALGIINKAGTLSSTAVSASAYTSTSQSSGEKKNRLVKEGADGEMVELAFEKIQGEGTMTQDDYSAQLHKLYIAQDFIYFLLDYSTQKEMLYERTNHARRASFYEHKDYYSYDQIKYLFSDKSQGFMIDRNNGHIYSLASIGDIAFIEDDYVVTVAGKGYHITVENNDAVFTNILQNTNVKVSAIYKDPSGIVYVANSSTNETVGNKVYFTQDSQTNSSFKRYTLGSDGRYYRYGDSANTFQVFNNNSWEDFDVSANTGTVTIFFLADVNMSKKLWVINNSDVYCISTVYYSYDVFYSTLESPSDTIAYDHSNQGQFYYFNKTIIERTPSGTLNAYYLDGDPTQAVQISTNVGSIDYFADDYMTFTRENVTSTQTYIAYVKNGALIYEQAGATNYNPDIILLKPI